MSQEFKNDQGLNPEGAANIQSGASNTPEDKWLSMSEASALVPYSAEYLSLLARKKKLAAKKVGKTWYTTKSVLDEYMKRQMIRNQIQNGHLSAIERSPRAEDAAQKNEAVSVANPASDMIVFAKKPIEGHFETTEPSNEQGEMKMAEASAASDHPHTKRVRTYHSDLQSYLDMLNAERKKEGGVKVEHVHVPHAFAAKIVQPDVKEFQKKDSVKSESRFSTHVTVAPQEKRAAYALEITKRPATKDEASNRAAGAMMPVGNLSSIEKTLSEISLKLEKISKDREISRAQGSVPTEGVAEEVSKALDQKFASLRFVPGEPNIVSKAFKTVFGSKPLIAATVAVALFFTIFPTPFVFGFMEKASGIVKKALTDANTVMGFRPGTHENEILLLDKAGNISIMGHIETEGQLRSFIQDGIAPIVVDSKTEVKNLNAELVGGVRSNEFTLAFVTKNGNVTTEDVKFEGEVEIGKTLLVRGATKLLSSLVVDGNLAVFGDARFSKTLRVDGPAYLSTLVNTGTAALGEVTTSGNLHVGRNATIRGALEVGSALFARSGNFSSASVSGDFSAGGRISLGNRKDDLTIEAQDIKLDKDGNMALSGSLALGGNLSVIGTITSSGVTFTGSTTLENLIVASADIEALIAANSTTTNATTTNFFASVGRMLTGVIDTFSSTFATIFPSERLPLRIPRRRTPRRRTHI